VTSRRWLREGRCDLATDRILDAAANVYVRQGVARTSMADVAREAGCSRATLYRYFDDRSALRTAFVHRETRRLAAEVSAEIAGVDDQAERSSRGSHAVRFESEGETPPFTRGSPLTTSG